MAFWVVLGLAIFMRTFDLADVPPGMHHDEVINGEIASLAGEGGFQLFYSQGWGREGLFYVLLAASRALPLPVHWQMRLPSVVSSLTGLILTYLWVRRSFGLWAAITAVAGMAVAFWTVALGRAVLRATTLLPVAAAAALLFLAILDEGEQSDTRSTVGAAKDRGKKRLWLKCTALAMTLGIAPYTYRAARVLPIVFLLFLLYLTLRRRPLPRALVASMVGAGLIALPLIIFLATHPGVEQRVGQVDRPWRELLAGNGEPVLRGALVTAGMFGIRGDPENHYNLSGRPVFEPVGAALFYVGVLIALRHWRRPRYALVLIWLGVGLLPGAITEPAPHFIHTVVAQPVVFVFPGLTVSALATWLGRRWQRPALWALSAGLIVWTVVGAYWTYQGYFVEWPRQEQVRNFYQSDLLQVARFLDDSRDNSPVAICTGFLNETNPFWRTGRQSLPYLLNRSDLAVRWYDCATAQVWPEGGHRSRYFFLGNAYFATWLPTSLQTVSQVKVLEDSASVKGVELESSSALGEHLMGLHSPSDRPASVEFGNGLSFLGYLLSADEVHPGDVLTLHTYWTLQEILPGDLAIFVHLLADQNTLLAQGDALALLSDTLRPTDIFVQQHTLTIPMDVRSGRYPLSIGVYSRQGEFPPWQIVERGQPHGERLFLADIVIQE